MRLSIIILTLLAGLLTTAVLIFWRGPSERDRIEIEELYDRFQGKLGAGDYSGAYDLMSPSYRSITELPLFMRQFKRWGGNEFQRSKESYVRSRAKDRFVVNPGEPPPDTYRGNFEVEIERVNGRLYITGNLVSITD